MKLIAGCVCLDFVNTVGGRVTGRDLVLRDKLKDYPDLLTWSRLAGLSTAHEVSRLERVAERCPARAAATLARAIRLREALYRIFKSILVRSAPDDFDVDVLRNELSIAKAHERLVQRAADSLDVGPIRKRVGCPALAHLAFLGRTTNLRRCRPASPVRRPGVWLAVPRHQPQSEAPLV